MQCTHPGCESEATRFYLFDEGTYDWRCDAHLFATAWIEGDPPSAADLPRQIRPVPWANVDPLPSRGDEAMLYECGFLLISHWDGEEQVPGLLLVPDAGVPFHRESRDKLQFVLNRALSLFFCALSDLQSHLIDRE